MGLISGLKNTVKNALGSHTLTMQHEGIKKMSRAVFSFKRSANSKKPSESFEETLHRLNLTEPELQERHAAFKRLSAIFILFASIVFIYFIYLLLTKSFLAAIGCIGILMIIASQIFRYNFWSFQIQQRKFDCTLKEWFLNLLGKSL